MKKVEIEDLRTYRFPENLQYNQSGSILAYQVAYSRKEQNDYSRDIWISKDGKARQLTSSLNSSILCWEDDEHLIISRKTEKDKEGSFGLYRISVYGSEAMPFMTLPFAVSYLKKIRDGWIALAEIDAEDPDAYKDDEETAKKKREKLKKSSSEAQIVDELPYYMNGSGYINKKRTAMFRIDSKGIRRITDPYYRVENICVDEESVFYSGQKYKSKESLYSSVYCYDWKKGKSTCLYPCRDYAVSGLFVMNGILYARASDLKAYGINQTADICMIDKKEMQLVKHVDRSLYCSAGTDCASSAGKQSVCSDGSFYTLATEEDHVEIWKYDKQFKLAKVKKSTGMIGYIDVRGTHIAYCESTADKLPEIYECDLNGKHVRQLSDLNSVCLKDRYVAVPHRVDYVSGKDSLHGWVLLPESGTAKKIPAVLDVHGGPRAVYGETFFHEMQVWASRGYAVFFTNIRGSDGRGDAFADIRGQYGYVDYQNLMDFTDAVLKAYPCIDKKRLCETGGSYGGFMTNWIIGHTNRFCCAASQRSISNWISMQWTSDIGPAFASDQCKAKNPYQDIEELWDHSPLKYADKVNTPTLFIHSDEDYRCPLSEGMQMMQAIANHGVETRMAIFHKENHELSRSGRINGRLRRLTEITGWFDKHYI